MANESIRIHQSTGGQNSGIQNTGNPVLDSLVNIIMAHALSSKFSAISFSDYEALHEKLLEFASKEPGGLRAMKYVVPVGNFGNIGPEETLGH